MSSQITFPALKFWLPCVVLLSVLTNCSSGNDNTKEGISEEEIEAATVNSVAADFFQKPKCRPYVTSKTALRQAFGLA